MIISSRTLLAMAGGLKFEWIVSKKLLPAGLVFLIHRQVSHFH